MCISGCVKSEQEIWHWISNLCDTVTVLLRYLPTPQSPYLFSFWGTWSPKPPAGALRLFWTTLGDFQPPSSPSCIQWQWVLCFSLRLCFSNDVCNAPNSQRARNQRLHNNGKKLVPIWLKCTHRNLARWFSGKLFKLLPPDVKILKLKCTKSDWDWGSAPSTQLGSLHRSPRPPSWI